MYLRMWELIKATPENERREFLEKHMPSKGRDVEFQGELFFDVDLNEALRNSLR